MPNKRIIENAKKATELWEKLKKEDQNKLEKYFHLRPTQSGITIVSTLSFLPMRGLVVTSNRLSAALNFLTKNYQRITKTDEDDAKKFLINKNNAFFFKSRSGTSILEEDVQSTMINTMSDDSNLSTKLNRSSKIKFVASELRFQQGKHKVDIIGYDKEDLYLFELKRARTSKMEQLTNYLEYYNNKHLGFLRDLLKNYPINPVKDFNQIKGCMIMQYCEDKKTRDDLKNKAKSLKINLLFFNSSLSYK